MHEKICSFCGHRDVFEHYVEDMVKIKIASAVEKGFTTFYSGGMGEFDAMCERAVREVKKNNDNIKLCLILPYMTSKISKNREYYNRMYDDIILPDFGNIHPRRAIPERNRWIVNHSDAILAYVFRETGGAHATLEYAEKMNVQYVNVYRNGGF